MGLVFEPGRYDRSGGAGQRKDDAAPGDRSLAGDQIVPVILCGGSGTRLWPVSRLDRPKQLIPINGRSLFQHVVLRVSDRSFARPIIIANDSYRFAIAEQLAQIGVDGHIVLEPEGRDSGPAVAVAADLAARADPESTLVVLPCDHYIGEQKGFVAAIEEAQRIAATGRIVTFGVTPDRASTDYGYIHPGSPVDLPDCRGRMVTRFSEKPDEGTASTYLRQGALWNSGIFVFRSSAMLKELSRHAPGILKQATAALEAAQSDLAFLRLDAEAFASAPAISIDYAIMEHTRSAAVLPAEFGWRDLGSWEAVWDACDRDGDGNVMSGDAVVADTENSLIQSEGPLTMVVGMRDAVIVSTSDAVLVADRAAFSEIKHLVRPLQQAGRNSALRYARVDRPWGYFEAVASGPTYRVKRIHVRPGHQLSLQKHTHRAEHWTVVTGCAEIIRGDESRRLGRGESLSVPAGVPHRLSNPGNAPLEIIEVQTGDILDEKDIVRIADDYGRTD